MSHCQKTDYLTTAEMCGACNNQGCDATSEVPFYVKCSKSEPKSILNSFGALSDDKDTSNSIQSYENCTRTEKQNTESDDSVFNRKKFSDSGSCRVPSTPTLIVSDTSTGTDNFLLEPNQMPYMNFNEQTYSSGSTLERPNRIMLSKSSNINCKTYPRESACNNFTDISAKGESDSQLFMPLKMCDSAYGSSMESRSGTFSPSVYCNESDVNSNVLGSENDHSTPIEHFNDQQHCDSLSVYANTPMFSSSSSLASGYVGDAESHDSESSQSATLQIDKDVRKLSSSSTVSLRSLTSHEESEEDLVSSDDVPLRPSIARRSSKMKAQKSWMKLRIALWSPFMQSYKKKYPWVQLAGHAGSFQPGEEGCILKKYVDREANCLEGFKSDSVLRELVPTFHGIVTRSDGKYTRMQDLLLSFESPSIMDCKMGIRTYLEDELLKAKVKPCLRPDMYEKMVEISPEEPTAKENEQKAVTKPRYMQWREKVSSTSTLGFRIEGVKKTGKEPSKDFKLTKSVHDVSVAFKSFIAGNLVILEKYIKRLKSMRATLANSDFFASHEVIGSSLLFVHDSTGLADVWMIDFGKTTKLPAHRKLDHKTEWKEGNREDGYLFGMDNMIGIYDSIYEELNKEVDSTTKLECNTDSTASFNMETSLGDVCEK